MGYDTPQRSTAHRSAHEPTQLAPAGRSVRLRLRLRLLHEVHEARHGTVRHGTVRCGGELCYLMRLTIARVIAAESTASTEAHSPAPAEHSGVSHRDTETQGCTDR